MSDPVSPLLVEELRREVAELRVAFDELRQEVAEVRAHMGLSSNVRKLSDFPPVSSGGIDKQLKEIFQKRRP